MTNLRLRGFFVGICAIPITCLLTINLVSCGSGDDSNASIPTDGSPDQSTGDSTMATGDATNSDAGDASTADASNDAGDAQESDGESDGGGPDADAAIGCPITVPTLDQFFPTLANTTCEHFRTCCQLTTAQFNLSACLGIYGDPSFGGWLGTGPIVPRFDAGTIVLDPSNACTCLAGTSALNCGSNTQQQYDSLQASCFAATRGSVDGGSACASSYDCAPGLYCAPGDAGGGVCTALAPDGGACASVYPSTEATDFACSYRTLPSPELYCDTTSNTCVPRLANAAATSCAKDQACESNSCLRSGDAGVCQSDSLGATPAFCTYLTIQPDAGDGG
jgi:hypothetical protein